MKSINLIIVLALALVACSKPQNCDVPAQSTHLDWNLKSCTSIETAKADTIYVDHNSICDCEDFCASLERARQNSLRIYQTILDTTSIKELKEKTQKDYEYLNHLTPNCDCK